MNIEEAVAILQGSKFFAELSPANIARIAELCTKAVYDQGTFVFRQGDLGKHLYIIINGQIHLERVVNLGHRKGRMLIDTLGKSRTLGCWSVLLGESHVLMSSASVQKPTTLLKIGGQELRRMMMDDTHFGFIIMERLCFLLRERIQAAYGAMDRL